MPTDDDGLNVPPLLAVEIASPTTRPIDRGRKAEDYRLGGAEGYLLADLPGPAPVEGPTVEIRRPGRQPTIHTTTVSLAVGGRLLDLEPARLVR